MFPKFSLTGMAGLESISASNWFDYASRYWSAGPTVQWELFEAGSIRANVRVQNARQEQALDHYQQTVLVALEDAENALTAYAREQDPARIAVAIRAGGRAGAGPVHPALQERPDGFPARAGFRTLALHAQDALVQSDQTVSLDLVQLYKALGGGWQEETNQPTAVTTTQ